MILAMGWCKVEAEERKKPRKSKRQKVSNCEREKTERNYRIESQTDSKSKRYEERKTGEKGRENEQKRMIMVFVCVCTHVISISGSVGRGGGRVTFPIF